MENHVIFVGQPATGKTELETFVDRRQHLCLADKMRLMANTLRGCKEKQCIGMFYDQRNNSMCAYGALGFLSGIPKDELIKSDFTGVLKNYGMDLDDSFKKVILPEKLVDKVHPQRDASLGSSLYLMNDRGFSFVEIADTLDNWANNLQS